MADEKTPEQQSEDILALDFSFLKIPQSSSETPTNPTHKSTVENTDIFFEGFDPCEGEPSAEPNDEPEVSAVDHSTPCDFEDLLGLVSTAPASSSRSHSEKKNVEEQNVNFSQEDTAEICGPQLNIISPPSSPQPKKIIKKKKKRRKKKQKSKSSPTEEIQTTTTTQQDIYDRRTDLIRNAGSIPEIIRGHYRKWSKDLHYLRDLDEVKWRFDYFGIVGVIECRVSTLSNKMLVKVDDKTVLSGKKIKGRQTTIPVHLERGGVDCRIHIYAGIEQGDPRTYNLEVDGHEFEEARINYTKIETESQLEVMDSDQVAAFYDMESNSWTKTSERVKQSMFLPDIERTMWKFTVDGVNHMIHMDQVDSLASTKRRMFFNGAVLIDRREVFGENKFVGGVQVGSLWCQVEMENLKYKLSIGDVPFTVYRRLVNLN